MVIWKGKGYSCSQTCEKLESRIFVKLKFHGESIKRLSKERGRDKSKIMMEVDIAEKDVKKMMDFIDRCGDGRDTS